MSDHHGVMARCAYCGRCEVDRTHGACQGCGAPIPWHTVAASRPSWAAQPGDCVVIASSLARPPSVPPWGQSEIVVRAW